MENNRKCIICNSEYSYCPTCSHDREKPNWMTLFDNDNCHEIYNICVNYRDGNITQDKAKDKLSRCDLDKLEDFEKGTKNMIKEIMNIKDIKEKEKEKEEIKIEEETKIEVKEDIEIKTTDISKTNDTKVASNKFIKKK